MILDIFKRKHSREEIEAGLRAFDATTATMEGRIAEIRVKVSDLTAREAVEGELDRESAAELKDLRKELAGLLASQEGRPRAREKLAQALEAAQFEEAAAERSAKVRESKEWKGKADAACDDVADAVRALSTAIVAAQRMDQERPDFIAQHAPSVYPRVPGLVEGFFRALDQQAFAGGGVDPNRFAALIGAVENVKTVLDAILRDIEAGGESFREHARRLYQDELAARQRRAV